MESEDFSALDLDWGHCSSRVNLSWVALTDVGLVGGHDEHWGDQDQQALEPVVDEALAQEMSAMGLPSSFSTSKQFYMKRKCKGANLAPGERCADNDVSRHETTNGVDCWYQAYDTNYSCYYYYNCGLDTTQWEVPDQPYVPLSNCDEHCITKRKIQTPDLEDTAPCNQEPMQGVTSEGPEDHGLVDRTRQDDVDSVTRQQCSAQEHRDPLSTADEPPSSVAVDNTTAARVRSSMPRQVFKYWLQRYSLFSRYDDGIKLDTAGWFSATPECLAEHQAQRCRSSVIIDAFTGVGGNAIQFARYCDRVIAIDTSPQRLEMARNNADIYGQASKIDFICGDFFQIGPRLQADVVFISPPWGGPCYRESDTMMIDHSSELGQSVYQAISISKAIVKKSSKGSANGVAVFLPKNSHLLSVSGLVSGHENYEIEVAALNGRVKALTAYFGNF